MDAREALNKAARLVEGRAISADEEVAEMLDDGVGIEELDGLVGQASVLRQLAHEIRTIKI